MLGHYGPLSLVASIAGFFCLGKAFGESPQRVEFWNDNGCVAFQKADVREFYIIKLSLGILVCIIFFNQTRHLGF